MDHILCKYMTHSAFLERLQLGECGDIVKLSAAVTRWHIWETALFPTSVEAHLLLLRVFLDPAVLYEKARRYKVGGIAAHHRLLSPIAAPLSIIISSRGYTLVSRHRILRIVVSVRCSPYSQALHFGRHADS